MTTEMIEVINVAPIFNFIYNLLALLGALTLICLIIFLTYSHKNIGMFARQNDKFVNKLLDKFPLVSEEFVNKGLREQNVENNQEIHEQNERLDAIEAILAKSLFTTNICMKEVGSDN